MIKGVSSILIVSLVFNSITFAYAHPETDSKDVLPPPYSLTDVELEIEGVPSYQNTEPAVLSYQAAEPAAPSYQAAEPGESQGAPPETIQLMHQLAQLDEQNAGKWATEDPQWIQNRLRNIAGSDWEKTNRILRQMIQYHQTPVSQRRSGDFDPNHPNPELREINQAMQTLEAYHGNQVAPEPNSPLSIAPPVFECFYPPSEPMIIYHSVLLAIEVLWLFGLIGCVDNYCDQGYSLQPDYSRTSCSTHKSGSSYYTTCSHPDICVSRENGYTEDPHRVFRHDRAFQYIGIPEFVFLGAQALPLVVCGLGSSLKYLGQGLGYACVATGRAVSHCFGRCCKSRRNMNGKTDARRKLEHIEGQLGIEGFADQAERISEAQARKRK